MAQDGGIGSGKIRLFVDAGLAPDAQVALNRDQAHYLFTVMRQAPGSAILLFNGRDGEWAAEVAEAGKKSGVLICRRQTRVQEFGPDLWLIFAPLKKARTDFIAEKACEMGCRRLLPVFTGHTNTARVNVDRLRAHAAEAAEQCGLLAVPEVTAPQQLGALLDNWSPERRLLFCDEGGAGAPAARVLAEIGGGPWAVLIGPEGGFSDEERGRLATLPWAHVASLGPRILRADTAAVAALTIWQSVLGDWK
ncbi:MAG: 16S rRNA (uracil(1498)-N(3))-methyltransferase [Paracoccaceae bacterium]|nr:16S rRNA (uracil(1498)-N(3))-methyltransferase [Paracoccaceae bacterium]